MDFGVLLPREPLRPEDRGLDDEEPEFPEWLLCLEELLEFELPRFIDRLAVFVRVELPLLTVGSVLVEAEEVTSRPCLSVVVPGSR